MHFFTTSVAVLAVAQTALAAQIKSRTPMMVKETHFAPSKFAKVGIPESDHMINLRIGLANTRFHELERHLYEGKIQAGDKEVSVTDLS